MDEAAKNIQNPKRSMNKKKIIVIAGAATLTGAAAFVLYKKIHSEFKKRDKQIDDLKEICNKNLEKINANSSEMDSIKNNLKAMDNDLKKVESNSTEIESIKNNLNTMDKNLKDLSKLSSNILKKLNSTSNQKNSQLPNPIDEIIEKIKTEESSSYNTNKTKSNTFFANLKKSYDSHMKTGKYKPLTYSDVLDAYKKMVDPNGNLGHGGALALLNYKYEKI